MLMIPRGQLSISFQLLIKTLVIAIFNKRRVQNSPKALNNGKSLFCLSARTGLDLALQALNFKKGSEILVTNINIPDMFTILEAHQLKCIPLTLNKHTLSLSLAQIEANITSQTKAILTTHLFGAIMPMEPIILLAKKYNLVVIEDCAQAFNHTYRGHSQSDVVLFSFGLIKTNTCLTGAMVCFADELLFKKVEILNAQLPKQLTSNYIAKIFKAMTIKFITLKWCYTLLYNWSIMIKKDFDVILAGFTKGFPGEDVMEKIKFRPCDANIWLLTHRTNKVSFSDIDKRKVLALQILQKIPVANQIGSENFNHSYWVLPIESSHPDALIATFRASGIDATAKASSLIRLSCAEESTDLILERLVYLPIEQKMLKRLVFPTAK